MSLVSVTKISSLLLASVAEQASLSLTWLETPEDTFSHGMAHIYYACYVKGTVILLFFYPKFAMSLYVMYIKLKLKRC